jgi:hypothetical protein
MARSAKNICAAKQIALATAQASPTFGGPRLLPSS